MAVFVLLARAARTGFVAANLAPALWIIGVAIRRIHDAQIFLHGKHAAFAEIIFAGRASQYDGLPSEAIPALE